MSVRDFEFPDKKQCLVGLKNIRKIRGELQRIKAKRDRSKSHALNNIRIKANQLQERGVQR